MNPATYQIYTGSLLDLLDIILNGASCKQTPAEAPAEASAKPICAGIPISRVIYSGRSTTVYFVDGTKTTVTCSANDTYDKQTAIVYALVKRIYGKVGIYDKNKRWRPNEIDGNGIGLKIEKIANSGFDQDLEKQRIKKAKETAKAEHLARQKAESEAAWKRRVAKRAEEIKLEREASLLADTLTKSSKKPLNETTTIEAKKLPEDTLRTTGLVQYDKKDAWKFYRKPDKPFSKFTQAEKREYWNYHNAKRRASGK
jgi:hypothetical protein